MNIAKMMQQAKRMQDDMKTLQERLKTMEVQGESNGVSVTMFGNGVVKSISIEPTLLKPEDKETVEDIIIAALNKARDAMEKMVEGETQKIMGGLQLPPGFQLPF